MDLLGGEDFYLRVWSIKSGEMLYEDKFMNSVPSVVCYTRGAAFMHLLKCYCSYIGFYFHIYIYGWYGFVGGPDYNRRNHFPGAWLGSEEGLFYVNTS